MQSPTMPRSSWPVLTPAQCTMLRVVDTRAMGMVLQEAETAFECAIREGERGGLDMKHVWMHLRALERRRAELGKRRRVASAPTWRFVHPMFHPPPTPVSACFRDAAVGEMSRPMAVHPAIHRVRHDAAILD